jgi:hypothetical protein
MAKAGKRRSRTTARRAAPAVHALEAVSLAVGSPDIGASEIRQKHALGAAGITTQPPVIAPRQIHHLEPGGLPKPAKTEGFQTRRIDAVAKRLYPPDGRPPDDITTAALTRVIRNELDPESRQRGMKNPGPDAVRRWRARFKD